LGEEFFKHEAFLHFAGDMAIRFILSLEFNEG